MLNTLIIHLPPTEKFETTKRIVVLDYEPSRLNPYKYNKFQQQIIKYESLNEFDKKIWDDFYKMVDDKIEKPLLTNM